VAVVLLVATGACSALYLLDTIKLDEAILGVTVVGVIATILALAKK
jgi:hypothetical protein